MLGRLKQLLLGKLADGKPAACRSPRWPAFRRAHLLGHPTCAACGGRDKLEVHHILPVHVDAAMHGGIALHELDEGNVLTLCEAAPVNCHLLYGHLRNWSSWNVNVVRDTAAWLAKILGRPKTPPAPVNVKLPAASVKQEGPVILPFAGPKNG